MAWGRWSVNWLHTLLFLQEVCLFDMWFNYFEASIFQHMIGKPMPPRTIPQPSRAIQSLISSVALDAIVLVRNVRDPWLQGGREHSQGESSHLHFYRVSVGRFLSKGLLSGFWSWGILSIWFGIPSWYQGRTLGNGMKMILLTSETYIYIYIHMHSM